MGYIDRNLLPDERILFRTKKHLIIFFYPLVLAMISMYAYQYMRTNTVLASLDWAPALISTLFAISVFLEYVASDFAITNKRIMMREGFFYRHANELRINTISQVNIDQTIFGQWLDYGNVSINAFGAFDVYHLIAYPVRFQRCVNEQLNKLNEKESG